MKSHSTSSNPWQSPVCQIAAGSVALTIFLQAMALGGNGPLVGSIGATLDLFVSPLIIVLLPPPNLFWRKSCFVVLLMIVLIADAILPVVVRATGHPTILQEAASRQMAPDMFLPSFVRTLGNCALLMSAAILGFRRGLARLVVDWLIAFGAIQIVVGFGISMVDPMHVWGVDKTIDVYRYTGTLINANANACLDGVFSLLAVGRWQIFLREKASVQQCSIVFQLITCFVAIGGVAVCALSGSRSALVVMMIGISWMIVRDPVSRDSMNIAFGRIGVWAIIAIIIAAVTTIGSLTISRLAELNVDIISRVTIWKHYLILSYGAPILGYGLGSFSALNENSLLGPEEALMFGYLNSAHNEVLQLALEGGWPYAILATITVSTIFATILRHGRAHGNDPVMRSVLIALLLILIEGIIDIGLDVPAVLATAAVLFGMFWGRAVRAGSDYHSGTI